MAKATNAKKTTTTAKAEAVAATEPEPEKAPKLNPAGWRDPKSVYAPDDNSIDARMHRLTKEIRG